MWRGQSVDSAVVDVKFAEENRRSLDQSKGLASGFPPSPWHSLEHERFLRPLFRAERHQIPPFSSKNVQIWQKVVVFRDRFLLERVTPWLALSLGRRFPAAPGIAKKARNESTVGPRSWQIWPRG